MKLSEHFTLDELTHSEMAVRFSLDNSAPSDVIENLKVLAAGLEEVRELLGCPMHVNSAYRALAVNRAVGGSSGSAHCVGLAADFVAPQYGTPQEIARAIRDGGIKFDQLIFEGAWVHISFEPKMRNQVLTARFDSGRATYTAGIA